MSSFRGKSLAILVVSCLMRASSIAEAVRIPFLRKKYTPLLFFKLPPGVVPECDELEKVVSKVEKELGVTVERLDVLRDPASQALLSVLTSRPPPFLYNQESCQSMSFPTSAAASKGANESDSKVNPKLDKDKVRAWAKGRYLVVRKDSKSDATTVGKPVVVSQQDTAMDLDELMEDMSLTPLQRKGKKAIKERTSGSS